MKHYGQMSIQEQWDFDVKSEELTPVQLLQQYAERIESGEFPVESLVIIGLGEEEDYVSFTQGSRESILKSMFNAAESFAECVFAAMVGKGRRGLINWQGNTIYPPKMYGGRKIEKCWKDDLQKMK